MNAPSPRQKSRKSQGDLSPARQAPPLPIQVRWGDLAQAPCDVILVGHYAGVLPQRAELVLDEWVSGRSASVPGGLIITEQARRGSIRGEIGEVSFFPGPGGRIAAVAGMGRPGVFGLSQLRRLSRSVAQVVGLLPRHQSLSTVVIGSGEGNLKLGEAAGEFLAAFSAAIDENPLLQFSELSFIERRLDRALEIQQALQSAVADLNRRSQQRQGRMLQLAEAVVQGEGGQIPTEFGCAMLLASLGRDDPDDAGLLDRLLARLPAALRDPVRERLVPAQAAKGQAAAVLYQQALQFRLQEPQTYAPQREAMRMTACRSGDNVHFTAITQTTTVTERVLERRFALALRASEKLREAALPEVCTQGRRLRRLLVHTDMRALLDSEGPLIVEVDAPMADVPWEMLPVGSTDQALAVHRPLARQLRTYYSPRPFDAPRSEKLRALVIGDPGEGPYELLSAREEACKVSAVLKDLGVECTTLIGAPEDGTGAGPVQGVAPADYFEVVDLLLSGEHDLVHFCGHAGHDTERADRCGWVFKQHVLTGNDLEGMDRPPRLVFANACLSAQLMAQTHAVPRGALVAGLADEFFRQGVRDYVGAAWEVRSQPAADFASYFYGAFLGDDGLPLGEALRQAREALLQQARKDPVAAERADWGAYQHYGDPGTRLQDRQGPPADPLAP